MPLRLPYWDTAPEVLGFIQSINAYLKSSNLNTQLSHLVLLRISQINGCEYCIDLHSREALRDGDNQARLDALPAYAASDMYDAQEKAALKWAEVLTNVAGSGASDAEYAAVSAQFDERDLVDLSFLISTMNAWNRISIAFDHGA